MATHPKGSHARVLLTSVFGPYAQDDEFGSRKINPMELYHNQVTREQGPFSLRMFHRSWGILMIQENISAPTTVLDFPTREAFAARAAGASTTTSSASRRSSSTSARCARCAAWCASSRRDATIVVGGHVAAIPGIEQHGRRRPHRARRRHRLDARVPGRGRDRARSGIPRSSPASTLRTLGMKLPQADGDTAATIIPSVGCPMGCNFCTTSAFFGGKGKFLNFYDTGDELFDVMCEMEAQAAT